jgi:hypothetical protein
MSRPWAHSASYHAWPSSTPVMDVVVTILAVASVVIGAHAGMFLVLAWSVGDRETAVENALFLLAIGLANAVVETLRHWRRHHGW